MVSGTGSAGQARGRLDSREIHLRQGLDGQLEIADDPDKQERGRDQGGRDRALDEGTGDAHSVKRPLCRNRRADLARAS